MGAGSPIQAVPLGGPLSITETPNYSNVGVNFPAMGVNADGTTTPSPSKVWSETQGQWVTAGPNSGAMPSSNIGGLNSALGTTSTAAPMQTSTYDTSAAPTPMPIANPTVGNANTATLGTGQTSSPFQGSGNPYIQAAQATTMGNLYGAQAATQANRINQNTPYGSLNYTQGVDQYGNPTWTANQQLSPELQALTQSSLQGLQQSQANPMYGINPGQTYSSAILSRLQPIQQQQQDRVAAQLANQGVVPGTEAYNRAQTQLAQQQNDQLTSAIVGGMQTGLSAQQLQNQTAANIKSLAAPNYINPYTQAAVAGPDYLGAYTTSQAAQIAAQNAANAKAANMQSGLFGLGNAALLGGGGIGSLGTNGTGGTGLLGLGSSAYNMFGNNGLNNPFVSSTDYMNNIGATSSGAFNPALSDSSYLENLYGNLGIF